MVGTTLELVLVHRLIRQGQQGVEVFGVVRKSGASHAQAHIQDLSPLEDNFVFSHGLLESLDGHLGQFPAGSG